MNFRTPITTRCGPPLRRWSSETGSAKKPMASTLLCLTEETRSADGNPLIGENRDYGRYSAVAGTRYDSFSPTQSPRWYSLR